MAAVASLEQKIQKSYLANGGSEKFTFPWAAVLQIIKDLLGGCTTNMAAQRWARRNQQAAREAIDEKFKTNAVFKSAKDRSAAVEATYEGFVNATRAQLRQVDLDD